MSKPNHFSRVPRLPPGLPKRLLAKRSAALRAVRAYDAWRATGDQQALSEATELIERYRATAATLSPSSAPWLVEIEGWAGYPIAPPVDLKVSAPSGPVRSRVSRTLRPDLADVFRLDTTPRSGFKISVARATKDLETPLSLHAIAESGAALRLDLPLGQRLLREQPPEDNDTALAGHVDRVYISANRQSPAWANEIADAISQAPVSTFELFLIAGMTDEAAAWFERVSPLITSRYYDPRAVKIAIALNEIDDVAVALAKAVGSPFKLIRVFRPTTNDIIQTLDFTDHTPAVPASARIGFVSPERFPLATLNDASLTSDGIVVCENSLVVIDAAAEPCAPFVAGQWDRVFASPHRRDVALVGMPSEVREFSEAVLVSSRCSTNYFHSLVEHAPRLLTIENHKQLRGVPLILDRGVPPNVVEAIRLLSPTADIVFSDSEHTIRVETLYVPLLHSYVPDSLEIPFEHIRLSPRHLQYLAERLRPHASSSTFPTRVYIRRSTGTRNLSNSVEVEALLNLHGFTGLDPSDLNLAEQIALFANATDIVGVGGAAFSNSIFCSESARATAFYAYQNRDYPLQRLMCESAGATFRAFSGVKEPEAPERWRTQEQLHSQFAIDLSVLDAHLTDFHSRHSLRGS
jgi:capsular polysaccharide biosynthesis protein